MLRRRANRIKVSARDRFFGYKDGLEQTEISFDPDLIYTGGSFDPKIAVAVFAANNFIAIGYIRAVRERGMDVPRHFALACSTKIEPMNLVKPTITMAIQSAYNFGTITTQLLLERLDGIPVERPDGSFYSPKL